LTIGAWPLRLGQESRQSRAEDFKPRLAQQAVHRSRRPVAAREAEVHQQNTIVGRSAEPHVSTNNSKKAKQR
jgi:hypothetical protein